MSGPYAPPRATLYIPPGTYRLTRADSLMGLDDGGAQGFQGLQIRGAGKGVTTLVFVPGGSGGDNPTKRNLFSSNRRAKSFYLADFSVEVDDDAASIFYFLDDGAGAQNEGVVFERIEVRGSCRRVFGFDGKEKSNLNSEMTFRNISAQGSYSDAFLRVGGISGVFSQQNQFVNYWFYDSSLVISGGTLFRFDAGGAAHFANGSWSSAKDASSPVTFISLRSDEYDDPSSAQFSFRGIRFEPKTGDTVVIDCRLRRGSVSFYDCSDIASLRFAEAESYNLHQYRAGVLDGMPSGPTVRYQSCALAGYHTFQVEGPAQVLGGFVYEGCSVLRAGNPVLGDPQTDPRALLRWTQGRPRYAFSGGWNYADATA